MINQFYSTCFPSVYTLLHIIILYYIFKIAMPASFLVLFCKSHVMIGPYDLAISYQQIIITEFTSKYLN